MQEAYQQAPGFVLDSIAALGFDAAVELNTTSARFAGAYRRSSRAEVFAFGFREIAFVKKFLFATLCCATAAGAHAEDDAAALAKQLANPVAALISVPFQFNYDQGIGSADDGERWLLNVQPVVPISINDNWNLISRTILPVVSQSDIFPGAGSQSGIGDVVQSVFFSPKAPTDSGWIWGAGPVLLVPTGSDELLTADKWAAGPTAVLLKQQGPWTYGALANQLWSFAGDSDRQEINATFIQPFLSYTWPSAWTVSMNTETTYDWNNDQASVPINVGFATVTKIGSQLVSWGLVARYWVDGPDGGPDGLGIRFNFTLLFPKAGPAPK